MNTKECTNCQTDTKKIFCEINGEKYNLCMQSICELYFKVKTNCFSNKNEISEVIITSLFLKIKKDIKFCCETPKDFLAMHTDEFNNTYVLCIGCFCHFYEKKLFMIDNNELPKNTRETLVLKLFKKRFPY